MFVVRVVGVEREQAPGTVPGFVDKNLWWLFRDIDFTFGGQLGVSTGLRLAPVPPPDTPYRFLPGAVSGVPVTLHAYRTIHSRTFVCRLRAFFVVHKWAGYAPPLLWPLPD